MEELRTLLTTELLFFVLGILAFCFVVRRGVETAFPTLSTKTPETTAQRVWEKFILPTMPMFVGILFGIFISAFPYPADMGRTWGTRAMFGAGCGFTSGWFYQVVKAIIFQRWQVPLPAAPATDTDPGAPPPPDEPSTPGGI
jgi:hypothetical protein